MLFEREDKVVIDQLVDQYNNNNRERNEEYTNTI